MTRPLDADGANWPGKLYANDTSVGAITPVATLVSGEKFTVRFVWISVRSSVLTLRSSGLWTARRFMVRALFLLSFGS